MVAGDAVYACAKTSEPYEIFLSVMEYDWHMDNEQLHN